MSLRTEAHSYAQRHSRGMQPVQSIGERLEAAYIAGATRSFEELAVDETEARILVTEMYGPSGDRGWEPAEWQLDNARAALQALRIHRKIEENTL